MDHLPSLSVRNISKGITSELVKFQRGMHTVFTKPLFSCCACINLERDIDHIVPANIKSIGFSARFGHIEGHIGTTLPLHTIVRILGCTIWIRDIACNSDRRCIHRRIVIG